MNKQLLVLTGPWPFSIKKRRMVCRRRRLRFSQPAVLLVNIRAERRSVKAEPSMC